MFSEYASRFLAQSQSRLSFAQPEEPPSRNPLQRPRRQDQRASRFQSTRSYLQRPALGNPYQQAGSAISNFPFASRTSNAPLFYSAHDQLKEDDDEEHEREVADFYALQRSRRQFGGSKLDESSEAEDGPGHSSDAEADGDSRGYDDRGFFGRDDIRSSWRGQKPRRKVPSPGRSLVVERSPDRSERGGTPSVTSSQAPMEDVGLESVMPGIAASELGLDDPPDDLAVEMPPDDNPPSVQQFRNPPISKSAFIPQETPSTQRQERPPPPESESSDSPPALSDIVEAPPRHDTFWATLYLISLAALFASFALVWLHTSAPTLKRPLGDTIYSTIHASYHLLAVDTLVAVIVSLIWLSLLKSYVRALVYTILVVVPIILFSFFLYPLISSFRGTYHGNSIQDKAMRAFAIIPGMLSILWAFAVYKGRHSLGKSVSILEFSCKILLANPGLSIVGFVTLGSVIIWTWVWMAMFTRVFLGGHLSSGARFFLIDTSTWWLGIFFVLVYLWTLGVLSGIQRATTAATVSQWYFHRLSVPSPTSREVITAALTHSTTTLFGTISLSTLLALLIRLPYLILPRRALALAGICSYTVLPSTIATLTNPLTLTYSAIHSQPLVASSRALARLSFLASSSSKHPHSANFHARNTPSQTPLHSYTLALLLLRATRFITSLGLGFGGWVSTARSLTLASSADGGTVKGSLYAYVVGLIAAAIGWGVLGAIDGVVAGVVDALVICWGSEVGRGGGVRYCREADFLFGEGEKGEDQESAGFLHGQRN